MTRVSLLQTNVAAHPNAISLTAADANWTVKATLLLRRASYQGMSMIDHANAITRGKLEHISYDEFNKRYSANLSDIAAVVAFAQSYGITVNDTHAAAASVRLEGTVADFNRAFGIILLSVEKTDYTHISYQGMLTVPAELNGIIEHVFGLHNPVKLGHAAKMVDSTDSIPAALNALTPLQIATAYQMPPNTGTGTCVGIIEYGGGYTQQNLTSSFAQIGVAVPTITNTNVDGGYNNPADTNGAPEVMLDIYVAGGIASTSTIAMYWGYGSGSSSPVAGPDWYDPINVAIHDTTNNPTVLSISWGAGDNPITGYWDAGTIAATDAVLAQAVVLGVTVCAASGDNGSTWAGYAEEVLYPASSPYVLACGGTTLQLNVNNSIASEIAWIGSGGGQSYYESLPGWQTGLTAESYPGNVIAALTMRGVPDVAGNSDPYTGYQFYWGLSNTLSQYGGTSACAPMWAGLIARINATIGGRVGFMQTKLYANHTAMRDITVGNNADYMDGYQCTVGWDAVTGYGSPIGTSILAVFQAASTGAVYPNYLVGTRPSSGQAYPRPQITA